MPAVYTFGETVYDIIFENEQPVAARPGGAMLNTAVSLGRCKQQVFLLSELGNDMVGRHVLSFLEDNGVSTAYIFPYEGFKTPVALAFLDQHKSASYSFYKQYPLQRLEQDFPSVSTKDVVLFGSFYSLSPDIRPQLTDFINRAKAVGAVIIYDPNIRRNHLDELKSVFPYVMENIEMADIIRGSEEDFCHLFNCMDSDKVFSQLRDLGCRQVIITKGEKGAELFTESFRVEIKAQKTKVISTIGAGDSFNAGVIHGILQEFYKGISLDDLKEKQWKGILQSGAEFAADACSGYDNYVSMKFASTTHARTTKD